jgi:predicted RNA-binding Zn-ribbon protein involved in translation (DUF1610 family)
MRPSHSHTAGGELRRAQDEMELALDMATAKCPYCGAIHLAPGFSELIAFRCDACGEPVVLRDDFAGLIRPAT